MFVVFVFLSRASVIVFSLGFRFIVRLPLCGILTYFTIENCRTFEMTELNVWKEKLRTLLNLKPTNSQRLLIETPHTVLIQKNTSAGNTRTIKCTRFCYTFRCLHFA